jgi:hypothetical protein
VGRTVTLKGIIEAGKGRAGSGGAWRMETDGFVRRLYHHKTLMLEWRIVRTRDGYGNHMVMMSTGYGSVSDQGGMNIAFRTLGLPYRFDRDRRGGGPRISEMKTHKCGLITDPAIDRCDCFVCGISR